MLPGFQRNHLAYQRIDVPLPADEERLYPALERVESDHRVLPPPADAQVNIAPQLMPSAPVFGVNSHAPQQRFAVSANSNGNSMAMPMPMNAMQYPAPNAQGYIPLRDEQQVAVSNLPLPPPFEPFISDSAQTPPSVEELTDRIKNSVRSELRIQGMFSHAWRFFGKNFCSFCGTQILMLGILIGSSVLLQFCLFKLFPELHSKHLSHISKERLVYIFLIEYAFVVLFWFPLFMALLYAILRAVQTNRFLMFGEYLKYFSQHHCRLFGFSLLTSLFVFPFFMIFSFIGYILYLFLFSFAAPLKLQYPEMNTCKAYALSARISLKNWPKMLLLTFILILFNCIGLLTFFGLLITVPLSMAVNVYVYHKLIGLHSITGYSHVIANGRDEQAYDGTGANVDNQTVLHAQQMQMQMQQQQQAQAPQLQLQPQPRVQFVQLVPVMRVSPPGILPPPVVSAGAPGGPMVVMRSSGVQSV